MNIITKLSASTMPVIENMKSESPPKKRALASSSFMYCSEKTCTSAPMKVTMNIMLRVLLSISMPMSSDRSPIVIQVEGSAPLRRRTAWRWRRRG